MINDYLTCAFWSSTDDNGEPLDVYYDFTDLGEGQFEKAERDLTNFLEAAKEFIGDDVSSSQVAHDFWLARNNHGSGFWDRPELYDGEIKDNFWSQWFHWYRERNQDLNSQKLTKLAHSFGQCDLYVGDDGKLYFFP